METFGIYWAQVWKSAWTDNIRFAVGHTAADCAAFNARRKRLVHRTLLNYGPRSARGDSSLDTDRPRPRAALLRSGHTVRDVAIPFGTPERAIESLPAKN